MAHSPAPHRTRRTLAAAALLALLGPAAAQTLGELDVRSGPGEPLDATIELGTAAGAPVAAECVFLSRGSAQEGPFVTRAQVAVYDEGGVRYLRLKSAERVTTPAARLRVVIRCPGQPHVAYREYRNLLAPPLARVEPPMAAEMARGAVAESSPAPPGGFPVRAGDTLESLAATLFPRQGATQRAYIEALRERNPALASLGPRDPIPGNATIELPDLRALPRSPRPPPLAADRIEQPAPVKAAPRLARAASQPRAQPPAESRTAPPGKPAPAAAAPQAATARGVAAGDGFTLRLSANEVDLSRSRGIDDSARAKLRERLLVLDNDDQVAALLQLRDSLKRLEGRVAELQLKLSGPPASLASRAEPKPAAPKVEAPKAEPPKAETPKIEAPKVAPPKTEPPPAPVPVEAPKAAVAKKPASTDWGFALSDALWIVVALLVALALGFAWLLVRRRRNAAAEEALPEIPTSMPVPPSTERRSAPAAEVDFDVAAPAPSRRREIASDAGLATEVSSGDPAALRRRYIEQRFPEIAHGPIALGDPDSVVKAARLFYEDGAVSRAVELLQFTTEEHPAEQKPWLALFEIFRLERLQGQFADLAVRFRDRHGQHPNWRKVQYFGREIAPGNALYRDLSVGIETIKFEAGKPPAAVAYDPIAENWLNAPMDFENELLVVELRRALMAQARITDEDLVPNPMPALRSVEMFTVA